MNHEWKVGDRFVYSDRQEFDGPYKRGNMGHVVEVQSMLLRIEFDCENGERRRGVFPYRLSPANEGPW